MLKFGGSSCLIWDPEYSNYIQPDKRKRYYNIVNPTPSQEDAKRLHTISSLHIQPSHTQDYQTEPYNKTHTTAIPFQPIFSEQWLTNAPSCTQTSTTTYIHVILPEYSWEEVSQQVHWQQLASKSQKTKPTFRQSSQESKFACNTEKHCYKLLSHTLPYSTGTPFLLDTLRLTTSYKLQATNNENRWVGFADTQTTMLPGKSRKRNVRSKS